MTLDFEENGIHFHAEKGLAYAFKGEEKLWSAYDVFVNKEPTKEVVLALHKMLDNF